MDWLAERGGSAVEMEDYCHSFEHTVELQMVFLQHVLGPNVKVLPILCGPYAHSLYRGGQPEDHDGVKRFLDALGELRDREGDRLFWILGVDMAHMGVRYQDDFEAVAGQGLMEEVGEPRRTAHRAASTPCDAAGFWDLVREQPRRSEVVRLRALLHLPEGRSRKPAASCCATSNGTSTSAAW